MASGEITRRQRRAEAILLIVPSLVALMNIAFGLLFFRHVALHEHAQMELLKVAQMQLFGGLLTGLSILGIFLIRARSRTTGRTCE